MSANRAVVSTWNLDRSGGSIPAFWFSNGVDPGDLTITKRQNDSATGAALYTTLLCSYPKSLTYKGSGDLLSASNYVCQ